MTTEMVLHQLILENETGREFSVKLSGGDRPSQYISLMLDELQSPVKITELTFITRGWRIEIPVIRAIPENVQ